MTDRVECKLKAKELLRGRWGNAAGMCLILFLLNTAVSFFLTPIPILGLIIVSMFSAFFLGTVINYFKKLTETDEKIKYTECFITLNKSCKIFAFKIIVGIIIFLLVFWGSTFSVSFIMIGIATLEGVSLLLALLLGIVVFLLFLLLDAIFFAVPMILVDEENIGIFEAVKKSFNISKGFRIKYIVIRLSFIGWAMLTVLTFGIGMFWLYPYMNLTLFIFYRGLNKNTEFDLN